MTISCSSLVLSLNRPRYGCDEGAVRGVDGVVDGAVLLPYPVRVVDAAAGSVASVPEGVM